MYYQLGNANLGFQVWLGNTADSIFNAGYCQMFFTKAFPARRTKTDNNVFYRSSCSTQPLAKGKLRRGR